jgi:hypothetical protein
MAAGYGRAAKDSDGYGKFSVNGDQDRAHRVAYVLTHGPIKPGQIVRHTCDCPPCCRPDHLIPGTHLDNAADRDQRGRNGKAKLNPTLVCLIRAMSARRMYRKDIAMELGIPLMTVHHAASRRTWKWVP